MAPERRLIPLFPLSNVVLFPQVVTPLHIFEPRYRQMTEAALSGERTIGMVAVVPEGVADLEGNPEIFEVGCAGVIETSRRLPDGRYDIVLRGSHRFRVLEEKPTTSERLYRLAEVELLDDVHDAADQETITSLRGDAMRLVDRLVRRLGNNEGVKAEAFAGIGDSAFVNSLANGLTLSPREKQGLLEADSIRARFEQLVAVLDFALEETRAGRGPNSGALH